MKTVELYEEAQNLLERGLFEQAAGVLSAMLAKDPDFHEGYLARALAHRKGGQFAEALADYDRFIACNPSRVDAYYGRGFVHIKLESYQLAIADFTRVIEAQPDDLGALINRANAHRRSGAASQSIPDYLAALRIDSRDPHAMLGLAMAYDQCGQSEHCIQSFSEYLKVDQENTEALFRRGINLAAAHRYAAAAADFSRVIEIDPSNKEAFKLRAEAYVRIGSGEDEQAPDTISVKQQLSSSSTRTERKPIEQPLSLDKLELHLARSGQLSIYVHTSQGCKMLVVEQPTISGRKSLITFLTEPWFGTRRKSGEGTLNASLMEALSRVSSFGEPVVNSVLVHDNDHLLPLARAAWAKAAQVPPGPESRLETCEEVELYRKAIMAQDSLARLSTSEPRDRFFLKSVELPGINIRGLNAAGLVFEKSNLSNGNFSNCTLSKAKFSECVMPDCDFSEATADDASFFNADLRNFVSFKGSFKSANFRNANLTGAKFEKADLQGADFTNANLTNVTFKACPVNERTRLPKVQGGVAGVVWKGVGRNPFAGDSDCVASECRNLDDLLTSLQQHLDSPRLKKSLTMLKKQKFQLYADVSDVRVAGVVKSQTDEKLLYACALDKTGDYFCCTQNLNKCGGLTDGICKHLLVLIIGLARADELGWSEAAEWSYASRRRAGAYVEKETATNLFLKYRGAETGEMDWRPAETIPEDYYAY